MEEGVDGSQNPANQTRLKVEDALSYLDRVKSQFGELPEVYNRFLDIMKEFKSQHIDTPGVIERVSSLFRGHPELITGFNTFLPPGYRMEVVDGVTSYTTPNQSVMRPVHPQDDTVSSRPQSGVDDLLVATAAVPGQPVEFNHAISYVNKIKNRFANEPEVYKQFLEVLHRYQTEQRWEGSSRHLSETEVFHEVAALFHEQEDLLAEFSQFLPEASQAMNETGGTIPRGGKSTSALPDERRKSSKGAKRSRKELTSPAMRKEISSPALLDSDMTRYGKLEEFAFFEKLRTSFGEEAVYLNFLRCLRLYTDDVIMKHELDSVVQPFFVQRDELYAQFRTLLGVTPRSKLKSYSDYPELPLHSLSGETRPEVDLSTCRSEGLSYKAWPRNYEQPRCSGRDSLEPAICLTLNDTFASFPQWHEDSSFSSSRKTSDEEAIYRCEDERFELDLVIDLNRSTIVYLEMIRRKLEKMSPDAQGRYKMDERLGGWSSVLQRKSIERIYGDKYVDICDGLRQNPVVAVPLVLRRLRAKDEEWRDAQRQFNKLWAEEQRKHHAKSLDIQAPIFKANDPRNVKQRTLLTQVESAYRAAPGEGNLEDPAHMKLKFGDDGILEDVTSLLLHQMRRQGAFAASDKRRVTLLLHNTLPDLLQRPRRADPELDEEQMSDGGLSDTEVPNSFEQLSPPVEGAASDPEHTYTVLYGGSSWYLLFRYIQLLSERLLGLRNVRDALVEEEAGRSAPRDSTAFALKLKTPLEVEPAEYYTHWLQLVRSHLSGSLEATSYEESTRELFGIHAYKVFTIEKLVHLTVKQLQSIVLDESAEESLSLFLTERRAGNNTGAVRRRPDLKAAEASYQRKTEVLLTHENCFRFYFSGKPPELAITQLSTEQQSDSEPELARFSTYLDQYVSQVDVRPRLLSKRIFLYRNLRATENRNTEMVAEYDNTEVVFEPFASHRRHGSVRMRQTAESHSVLYHPGSLCRARQSHESVSETKYNAFLRGHLATWNEENVSSGFRTFFSDSLRADCRVVERDNHGRAPYRPLHVYYRKDSKGLTRTRGSSRNAGEYVYDNDSVPVENMRSVCADGCVGP